mmetsp:Transcript_53113/g.142009  ORF Transcript_53113/g.142009 Transcript_53113/m.142009 type:complete len:84 (+) Transcript_53113:231-482(+)
MTQIISEFTIVDSLCAMTMVVLRPSATNLSSASCTLRSLSVSRALVASSSKSTAGFRTMHRAIATRCFCPPLSWAPRSPTSVS